MCVWLYVSDLHKSRQDTKVLMKTTLLKYILEFLKFAVRAMQCVAQFCKSLVPNLIE